jgi:hypothetical protein
MATNKYRVSKKKWSTWSEKAKEVFNALHTAMMESPDLYWHPKQPKIHKTWWKTTAWNASWIAADAVDGK